MDLNEEQRIGSRYRLGFKQVLIWASLSVTASNFQSFKELKFNDNNQLLWLKNCGKFFLSNGNYRGKHLK